jgi:membrane protein YqaA with SNARE-associated domain
MPRNDPTVAVTLGRPTTLNPMAWLKWLYDWTLHWAQTPYGVPALAALAFAESSFFPVPPDVLLIALCLGAPQRSLFFAAICSISSVIGGIGGYLIGWLVWDQVSGFFFSYVFSQNLFDHVAALYQQNAFWAVFTAGFTPIPYKVFTTAGGVFQIDFTVFLLASALSRSARFFLVASLIRVFGPPIKSFIDKYFNLLSIAFVVLLLGGFVVIRLVL